jgi:hypothetical protein
MYLGDDEVSSYVWIIERRAKGIYYGFHTQFTMGKAYEPPGK